MNRPGFPDAPPDDSPDEPARDAWLSEALRHAPDADAAPSVAVREAILRQARAAAASPTPARRAGAWQRFSAAWSWLSGPRVAAGFASVMVATVVGLMWWDRPIDEALRPVEPPATVAAPEAAPTPAPQPAPQSAPIPAPSPPAPSAEPSPDSAAAAPPRATLERKREAVGPRADASNDRRREAAAAPAPPRAADETRAQAEALASARTDKEAQEIDAARERRAESAQSKAAAPAMRSAPAAAGGALYAAPAPAASPAVAPPAAAAQSRQARAAPLGALLEALAEESPRWHWQRDGTGERALTPELQGWLQRLARAVAARSAGAGAGQGSVQAPEQPPVQELRLLRDGGVQAVVRLGADGAVRIDIAGEPPLTAQLPAASASGLRRALDDATR